MLVGCILSWCTGGTVPPVYRRGTPEEPSLRYTREGSGMYGFGMLFMDFELMIDLICCFPPPMETK